MDPIAFARHVCHAAGRLMPLGLSLCSCCGRTQDLARTPAPIAFATPPVAAPPLTATDLIGAGVTPETASGLPEAAIDAAVAQRITADELRGLRAGLAAFREIHGQPSD